MYLQCVECQHIFISTEADHLCLKSLKHIPLRKMWRPVGQLLTTLLEMPNVKGTLASSFYHIIGNVQYERYGERYVGILEMPNVKDT